MKKAIKKTCVVLLLFALLVSQVAASYSETGTLNEGTSAISAAERYLTLRWILLNLHLQHRSSWH